MERLTNLWIWWKTTMQATRVELVPAPLSSSLPATLSITCAPSSNVASVVAYITCRSTCVWCVSSPLQNCSVFTQMPERSLHSTSQQQRNGMNEVAERRTTVKSGQQRRWPVPNLFPWCPHLFISPNDVTFPQHNIHMTSVVKLDTMQNPSRGETPAGLDQCERRAIC